MPTDPRGPRPTRRAFLAQGSALCLAGPLGRLAPPRREPIRGVIQIFLQGGLSHLDSFDPKPDAPADVRGEFGTVKTAVDGLLFADRLPATARVADRLVVVRSMTHGEAAHERGAHNMLTGYKPSPALTYPSFGAVVSHELGSRDALPPYVLVPGGSDVLLGTGYLGAAYGPFSVGAEPAAGDFKVRDLEPAAGVDAARQRRRRELLGELDLAFASGEHADPVRATAAFHDQAWSLIESASAREAFRIQAEPDGTRDRYGRTAIGQRLLLARRLVESGVRYVTVLDGGYDNHQRIFPALDGRLRNLDRAFGALIADLDARGALDDILVLLTSEFGRTPRINQDAGRDHWPKAFTVVLAGGGLQRGEVVGATAPDGSEPADAPVGPADLAATMFSRLGIDPTKRLMSPGDRPIDIVRGGRVLAELIA